MARLGLPLDRFGRAARTGSPVGSSDGCPSPASLVRRPEVLVLDEPTFGQDRLGYEGLLGIIREHLDQGAPLIAATHDRRFVRDVARRTIEMDDGWIVRDEAVA